MAQMKKKAAKKADPMKKSAASHQRSLAKMSGDTAARDKAAKMEKAKNTFGIMDQTGAAKGKAEKKALKSFGLKSEPYRAKTQLKQTNLDKTAGSRSKAGASTVSAVAKRFGVTVREARDIAKAIGNVAESAVASKNIKNPGQQYLGGQALKASVKDLKKQVKETGRAAKSGTTGTRAGKLSYNTDTGSPQGLVGKQRPKYRGSLTQY
jgi:hypothetical protein